MGQAGSGWAVLCDFDGTITERDMCLALLEAYADGDWLRLEAAYDEGRISLEECLAGEVGMLASPRDVLIDYSRREARVRSGFAEFVAYCRQEGAGFSVVSAGLDFYIDAILEREGLGDVATIYIRTLNVDGRLAVARPLAGYETLADARDFKEAVVRERKAAGFNVAFVGDGSTDFAAAQQADHVFARAKLLAFCQREGLPHTPFEDFHVVREGMRRLLGQK